MTADFKALDIGYEVQKSFANKFFSNKNVAKGLIDATSAALLDELYKLIKIYVSNTFYIFLQIFHDPNYFSRKRRGSRKKRIEESCTFPAKT